MSSQAAPGGWTEPPWSGWIETTGDALLILEAARRGLIPRVTRRLVDNERKMITSGSVFVFDEKESGIKRWTDGFFWSPSRILGNFLLYRETDKRGTGHRARADGDDVPISPPEHPVGGSSLSRPRSESNGLGIDKMRERSLMGSLTNSYKFKSDGLMKKTFSLVIDGVAQHLISYYRIEDVESGRLRSPSSLPELASLDISPELLDKTHFRNPPKVEVGPDGIPRYRGEADEIDSPPTMLTGPLSTGLPLLSDGRYATDKHASKRFDPYGVPAPNKRPRKGKGPEDATASASTSQVPQAYDPNLQMMQSMPPHAHPYPGYGNVYYPYHYGAPYMHPSGSPVPGVPPSTQSTPSPPVPSSSASTTPTPGTTGAMQGVTASSPTSTASPTSPTQTQPATAGSTQQPAAVAPTPVPYPYPYPPHYYHHPAAMGAMQATGAPSPSAPNSSLADPNATATGANASQIQQVQPGQMQPHPHHPPAYYPYYPPGMYQAPPGWPYGYMHGQPQQMQMHPHMQQGQVPQVPVPAQATQAQTPISPTAATAESGNASGSGEESAGSAEA